MKLMIASVSSASACSGSPFSSSDKTRATSSSPGDSWVDTAAVGSGGDDNGVDEGGNDGASNIDVVSVWTQEQRQDVVLVGSQ